jgi:hypothetical protein
LLALIIEITTVGCGIHAKAASSLALSGFNSELLNDKEGGAVQYIEKPVCFKA